MDTKSATAMFDLIKKKLGFSMAYPHFLSMLFHFLQLPCKSHNLCSFITKSLHVKKSTLLLLKIFLIVSISQFLTVDR